MAYRSRRYGSRSPFKLKIKKKTAQTVAGLFLLLASILSLLAFFGGPGLAEIVKLKLFDYFGWLTFLVPFAMAEAALLALKARWSFVSANTAAGLAGFIICLDALTAWFFPSAAGIVGRYLFNFTATFLSSLGAGFTFLVLSIASFVVIFNTSLERTFELLGQAFGLGFAGSKNAYSKIAELRNKEPKDERLPFKTKGMDESKEKDPVDPTALTTAMVSNLPAENQVWEYPPLDMLSETIGSKAVRGDIKNSAAVIEKTLESFGIQARVVEVNMGPAVTQYALEIALGTKLTKITSLANDIALGLAAPTGTVRIEAPIPGKSLVGIEVPNITPETVPLKSVLVSGSMQKAKSKISLALGLDVSGSPLVTDLARMPHVLIAGSTGSGKSVAINAFIATLLFRATPSEVKLILVDPKIVELSGWNGIPHLLTPVITEAEKVISALKWAVTEMEKRYKKFAEVGARNIDSFNEMSGFQALPYIIIIIDELADLMLFAPVEVEDAITRLAQMSRATGIHMILATQRPSVDVITGLIKANIPARIAFNVASQVDSRVIIDQVGADKLLGRGDMLYVPPDASKPQRIQGVFVSEPETNKLIEFLKKSGVEPQYTEEVTTMPVNARAGRVGNGGGSQDELFEEAVRIVCQFDRASASLLQRKLSVGYARAARILDELEAAGVVGSQDGSKARDVLVKDPARVLGGGEGQEA
ncbi:MAG: DNA translocase FtsK [bacterium]|nr:DNA translocase FtsK [bacterium]